mgnify:CR=1 FL=1
MAILLQVLEQSFTPTTPWEQRKFTYVVASKIVGMRLDGQSGVWLDLSRPGESQRLAHTPTPQQAVYFLMAAFGKIAECEATGGSWIIGHDGEHAESLVATRFPLISPPTGEPHMPGMPGLRVDGVLA